MAEEFPSPNSHRESTPPESTIQEIWDKGFEHARIIETPHGRLAFGIDIGVGRERQEDRLVIDTTKEAYAVIDGMGGMGKGDEAAQALAETLQKGFAIETPFSVMQEEASLLMLQRGVIRGGACYMALRIKADNLEIGYAGDVEMIIVDENGEIVHHPEPQGAGNIVFNAVSGDDSGTTAQENYKLKNGYRIYLASDGLWKQLSPDEAVKSTQGLPVDQAVQKLAAEAMTKMRAPGAHGKDNVTILVHDIRLENPEG